MSSAHRVFQNTWRFKRDERPEKSGRIRSNCLLVRQSRHWGGLCRPMSWNAPNDCGAPRCARRESGVHRLTGRPYRHLRPTVGRPRGSRRRATKALGCTAGEALRRLAHHLRSRHLWVEATQQTRAPFDSAIVCTGGGGLIAGIGTILRDYHESTSLFTAEPEGWDDHKMSLAAGARIEAGGNHSGFCDGLLAPIPGELTFKINTANDTQRPLYIGRQR